MDEVRRLEDGSLMSQLAGFALHVAVSTFVVLCRVSD